MEPFAQPNTGVQNAKKSFFGPKIIFIILGAIILIELIIAVKAIVSPSPILPLPKITTSVRQVGKISLSVPKTTFAVNETIPVSVIVNTGDFTVSGVDFIVNFDPELLTVSKSDLVKGNIFSDYPLLSVNSGKGVVAISGILNTGNGYSGSGQFAQINFKAKAIGKTSLTIDFKEGSTTASTMVESETAKNILEQVDNLEITIL